MMAPMGPVAATLAEVLATAADALDEADAITTQRSILAAAHSLIRYTVTAESSSEQIPRRSTAKSHRRSLNSGHSLFISFLIVHLPHFRCPGACVTLRRLIT